MTPSELADQLDDLAADLPGPINDVPARDCETAAAMLREAERLLAALATPEPPKQGISAWRDEALAWLKGADTVTRRPLALLADSELRALLEELTEPDCCLTYYDGWRCIYCMTWPDALPNGFDIKAIPTGTNGHTDSCPWRRAREALS